MFTEKEKNALIGTIDVGYGLMEGVLVDEETGLANDGFGDFMKSYISELLEADGIEKYELTTREKKEFKKQMNAMLKSLKIQLYRIVDEEF